MLIFHVTYKMKFRTLKGLIIAINKSQTCTGFHNKINDNGTVMITVITIVMITVTIWH